jgi:hypothetical protein
VNGHEVARGNDLPRTPGKRALPFLSRLMIVGVLSALLTYCVALAGERMPANPVALVFLPIFPELFLAALLPGLTEHPIAFGFVLSLFLLAVPTLLIAICHFFQRRSHLVVASAIVGIVNGLLVRWVLYFAHALAT